MTRLVLFIALFAMTITFVGGPSSILNAQQHPQLKQGESPFPPGAIARPYQNLKEKLVQEFLVIHNNYTPEVLAKRCDEDPNWTPVDLVKQNGIVFLRVKIEDGTLAFGYPMPDMQVSVLIFTPINQPFADLPFSDALKAVIAESSAQFEMEPEFVNGGYVVYGLTKEIVCLIAMAPDGTYSSSTGFRALLRIPDKSDI